MTSAAVRGLRRAASYVVYERNPLVQVRASAGDSLSHAYPPHGRRKIGYSSPLQCIYVTVMSASYFLFVTEAHPLIPNDYAAAYHKCVSASLLSIAVSESR